MSNFSKNIILCRKCFTRVEICSCPKFIKNCLQVKLSGYEGSVIINFNRERTNDTQRKEKGIKV